MSDTKGMERKMKQEQVPRLPFDLSKKLHDAGIVVESEYVYVSKDGVVGSLEYVALISMEWLTKGCGMNYPIICPAPIAQEMLMTKEAKKLSIQISVGVEGVELEWDGKETRESNWDVLDWQSATNFIGELLLRDGKLRQLKAKQ